MIDLTPALSYLSDYETQLDSVHLVQDLKSLVLDWQFENRARSATAQDKINNHLFKGKGRESELKCDQIPTTFIGALDGIVVLSANPGYDSSDDPSVNLNKKEMQLRSSQTGNARFCKDFFLDDEILQHAKLIAWWNRVAVFAHRAECGPNAGNKDNSWEWARQGRLGAADLIPFHSQRDGITNQILSTRGESPELVLALRKVATSTVNMVIRLKPKVIVAASAAGSVLAELSLKSSNDNAQKVKKLEDLVAVSNDSKKISFGKTKLQWNHQHVHHWHRFRIDHADGQSTIILSFPYQIFSARTAMPGAAIALADKIHACKLLSQ